MSTLTSIHDVPRLAPTGAGCRRPTTRQRWLVRGFVIAGVGMVPWLFVLGTHLPSAKTVPNWSAAWVGLDAMEAAGLLVTGTLIAHKDERHKAAAAATAALLVTDAWFDLATSSPGPERAGALAMALGAELPIAVLCATIAIRRIWPLHAAQR